MNSQRGPVLKNRTILVTLLLGLSSLLSAQDGTVRGTVKIPASLQTTRAMPTQSFGSPTFIPRKQFLPDRQSACCRRTSAFKPHVLAVTVGTAIEFPNQDPFFTTFFPSTTGSRFDLGLYESGAVRKVRFMQVGVSTFSATSTGHERGGRRVIDSAFRAHPE